MATLDFWSKSIMPHPKVCAICGYGKATTRDHVPPRGIFPRPLPVRMVTVPACAACNNGSNQADERFRVLLAASTAYFDEEATRLWREEAMRTLHANARLAREFHANTFTAQIEGPDGTIVERPAFRWPVSAYAPVVERIVRGLYYHHFGKALGKRALCESYPLSNLPDEFVRNTGDWPQNHVGDNIFRYRYGCPPEAPLRSFWVLQFFQCHWAAVETYPADSKPMLEAP